jgi:hypothetical protein
MLDCVQAKGVISVSELKHEILGTLEKESEWTVDKKTLIRMLWRLARIGLVRCLCFRLTIRKTLGAELAFLGDSQEALEVDKATMYRSSSNFFNSENEQVLYYTLVTPPEVSERDA